jgi:hypothetical protein
LFTEGIEIFGATDKISVFEKEISGSFECFADNNRKIRAWFWQSYGRVKFQSKCRTKTPSQTEISIVCSVDLSEKQFAEVDQKLNKLEIGQVELSREIRTLGEISQSLINP